MSETLSQEERILFERYKEDIRHGLQAWQTVAHALHEIKEQRLYREDYPTFEQFVNLEFQISRQHAYRLIEAFEVFIDLVGTGSAVQVVPQSERIIRELMKYPKGDRKRIWKIANDRAELPAKRITRKLIRDAAKDVAPITDERVKEFWVAEVLEKLNNARRFLTFSADFSQLTDEQKHKIGLALARCWNAIAFHVKSLSEAGHVVDLSEAEDDEENDAEQDND